MSFAVKLLGQYSNEAAIHYRTNNCSIFAAVLWLVPYILTIYASNSRVFSPATLRSVGAFSLRMILFEG